MVNFTMDDSHNSGLPVFTCCIGAIGILTNSLSLSYFLSKKDKSLPTKLIMHLNVLDLAVCIFSPASFYFNFHGAMKVVTSVLNSTYYVLLESTSFATCMLSVTRMIQMKRPFYTLNFRAIVAVTSVYNGYLVIR